MLLVFKASSMKRACFWRFLPEQLCSYLSWQIKSLLSLNWLVLKVLIVKFQASTLDQRHNLLINLFCKSARKPLDARSARSAVGFLQPILQLSKTSSRPTLRLRFLYCISTLRMCTNTAQHVQSKPSSNFALRRWLPTKAFYKTFAHIRSGYRCHLIFERLINAVDNRKPGVLNLFATLYHLGSPYCQCVPLLPEQLILSNLSLFRRTY